MGSLGHGRSRFWEKMAPLSLKKRSEKKRAERREKGRGDELRGEERREVERGEGERRRETRGETRRWGGDQECCACNHDYTY